MSSLRIAFEDRKLNRAVAVSSRASRNPTALQLFDARLHMNKSRAVAAARDFTQKTAPVEQGEHSW
jgi:hypothetical protein